MDTVAVLACSVSFFPIVTLTVAFPAFPWLGDTLHQSAFVDTDAVHFCPHSKLMVSTVAFSLQRIPCWNIVSLLADGIKKSFSSSSLSLHPVNENANTKHKIYFNKMNLCMFIMVESLVNKK